MKKRTFLIIAIFIAIVLVGGSMFITGSYLENKYKQEEHIPGKTIMPLNEEGKVDDEYFGLFDYFEDSAPRYRRYVLMFGDKIKIITICDGKVDAELIPIDKNYAGRTLEFQERIKKRLEEPVPETESEDNENNKEDDSGV